MRIKGSGTGSGSYRGSSGRSQSFRRKHRLGQKVQGVLLKNLDDNMAWVEIDGDRLLAQLEVPHPEGSRLTFVIKQLVPDIILKELVLGQGGVANALSDVSAFDTARTLFEAAFRQAEHDQSTPPGREAFLVKLASDNALYARFADAADCAAALSRHMESAGRLLYQPWLAADSRRQATLIRRTGEAMRMWECVVEFDHTSMGLVRCVFLHKDQQTACKVHLQHMRHSTPLQRYLASRTYPALGTEPKLLGISKLPPSGHGGIIAETVFKRKG